MLIESIIEIAKQPILAKELQKYFGDTDITKYKYADIDYLVENNSISIIRAALLSKPYATSKPSDRLQSYISNLINPSFNELLFIATLLPYHESDLMNPLPEYPYESKTPNLIDELLKDTKGYLVYHHQLEQLIAMANSCGIPEAVAIRKAIGKREAKALKLLNTIFIDKQSISQIMRERMFNPFTFYPNFVGAFILFKTITKN
jgi:hypothetical protein